MEQHGDNPQQNVIAIIPARYESVRLPGKMLLELAGRPLILHTLDRARSALTVSRVIVATDDKRIWQAVTDDGGEAVMTSAEHRSGSDRIAEVAASLPVGSIIVNVQGDEPIISPKTIDLAVNELIGDSTADVATTCEPISEASEILDPNVVKVVCDSSGRALFFSRSPIPFPRESVTRFGSLASALENEPDLIATFRKHTGLYVYRREYLMRFTQMPQTPFEKAEMLEQLRALENGAVIKVVETAERSIGVDTEADLELVRSILLDSTRQGVSV